MGAWRWTVVLALILQHHVSFAISKNRTRKLESVRGIWLDERPLNSSDIQKLRQQAWQMFDHGYSNYMKHAFPMDNLLPISCEGKDWQGGMGLTLIDALDTLLLLNRRADIHQAIELLRTHISFDKDIKVHFFETVIRALGGLLSAHVLLDRSRAVPEYDGLLLEMAVDLADRLLPAFNTPSGLPSLYVNLKRGVVIETNVTCTACAGTLLLEFGLLTTLTGNPMYMQKAELAARAMYQKRSRYTGLVGSSLDVLSNQWISREATIGPGIDSYYEYLLKAYLMFGNIEHLTMFVDLYVSTMRHLQLPTTVHGYSFLVDVHMDSGRLSRPFVSSLAAFWPGMQALMGQERDAAELHSNFTAAWRMFGWMPELFGLDLSKVHPEDPGYNLRPEHIESTYLLHCLTGNLLYLDVAAKIQSTLAEHNKVPCGYASILHVESGQHVDLQESFFLSETVKYLYLTFSEAPHLIDYYVLTTEGHLMPAVEDEAAHLEIQSVPSNCANICEMQSPEEQAQIQHDLQVKFPLIKFSRAEAAIIRRRRCIACVLVTQRMEETPRIDDLLKAKLMRVPSEGSGVDPHKALAQLVCALQVTRDGMLTCNMLRPVTPHDMLHGVPHNAVMLQLTLLDASPGTHALVLVSDLGPASGGQVSLLLDAVLAAFGPMPVEITKHCLQHLLENTADPFHQGLVSQPIVPEILEHQEAHMGTCPARGLRWLDDMSGPENEPEPQPDPHLTGHCRQVPVTSGRLVVSDPPHACTLPWNHEKLAGAIAVVVRGECSFIAKALSVQHAGAVGLIVINTYGEGELLSMSGDGTAHQPTIPAVLVTRSAGRLLLHHLSAATQQQQLTGTLALLPASAAPPAGLAAAGADAGTPSTPGRQQFPLDNPTTRVDLLIPVTSQAFLHANVLNRGKDLSTMFEAIVHDGRTMPMLMQVAQQNGFIKAPTSSP